MTDIEPARPATRQLPHRAMVRTSSALDAVIDQALCAQSDPAAWYPDEGGRSADSTKAKAICRQCPIRVECLQYAIDSAELWGVWGGATARERQRLRSGRIAA